MNWRQNPQRVAWLILTVSFSLCCLLAVVVPFGVRSYLLNATRPIQSYITVTAGTVQFYPPGVEEPSAVTDRRAVMEGGRIVTDATARSLLTSFVGDPTTALLATIQLYQDTDLRVTAAHRPRFAWNDGPAQIALRLQKGRVAISVRDANDHPVRLRLLTPHGSVAFSDGSYDISVEEDMTLVRTRAGSAQVLAANREVTVSSGERVSIAAGRPPELPVPAALNLVLNGKLEGRLAPLWQEVLRLGAGLAPGRIY